MPLEMKSVILWAARRLAAPWTWYFFALKVAKHFSIKTNVIKVSLLIVSTLSFWRGSVKLLSLTTEWFSGSSSFSILARTKSSALSSLISFHSFENNHAIKWRLKSSSTNYSMFRIRPITEWIGDFSLFRPSFVQFWPHIHAIGNRWP